MYLPYDGPAQQQDVGGFPIGIMDEVKYQEHTLTLRPGDRLYLYSDGIPEAFNAASEQFGTARLLEALEDGRGVPVKQSLDNLLGRVEAWGGGRLVDDVSVLAVEVTA